MAEASPKAQSTHDGPNARTTAEEPSNVLIVGDDVNMVCLLSTTLRLAGYQICVVTPGEDAVDAGERRTPDVVVQDGFEVTRCVRGQRRRVQAVFLTPGDQIQGRLPGLTIGGGEYLVKPFSPGDLVASVRAVLRRMHRYNDAARTDFVLRCADLELMEDTGQVHRAGHPIQLTPTEFRLLRYLMHNAGKVHSSVQILEHVWPYDYDGDDRVVATYIRKLRSKIDRTQPPLIHTVRGFGYSLRASAESRPPRT